MVKAEFVILWDDNTWTSEFHDVPDEYDNDNEAALEWFQDEIFPELIDNHAVDCYLRRWFEEDSLASGGAEEDELE